MTRVDTRQRFALAFGVRFDPDTWNALIRGERRGPLAFLACAGLRTLSIPYGLGVRVRNWLFDRGWKRTHRAEVPVISVGNLTLGGTGKTPCVEYLARLCRDRFDRRPAILSRGYGSHDEALVLEENLPDVPHLQGPDRAALAITAVEELEADVLILDDGFQHRRLARDLDILLIDATRPLRNEAMFPRGLLREPRNSLRRAGFAIFTRCDQANDIDTQMAWLKANYSLPVAMSRHEPLEWIHGGDILPPEYFRNRPVAAFCGLGNPAGFRATLKSLDSEPAEFRTFADHHNYTAADVESLRAWAATLPPDAAVLTTQKDWVKLRIDELAGRSLAALRIGLTMTKGEDELLQKLEAALGPAVPA